MTSRTALSTKSVEPTKKDTPPSAIGNHSSKVEPKRSLDSSNDSSRKAYGKVYTIKLSGLPLYVKRKKIENLVKAFGDLANVKIACYPVNSLCYAYVDFTQKSSAEQAVLKLDKFELRGTKLHVCHHKSELGVEHNCRRELEALNNPKDLTCGENSNSKLPTSPLNTDTGTLPSLDLKVVNHGEFEVSTTGEMADESTNVNCDLLSSKVDVVEGSPVVGCRDFGQWNCAKGYSIKLSGFRVNVKEWEIEWLAEPFGDLTDPIEILQYPESKISYALITYKHKSSAEKAVLKLDHRNFNNTKIHACHQDELEVAEHDCCNELIALNTPAFDEATIEHLNNSDLLDLLKTKSMEFKNNLALTSEVNFKNALRSVTVSSYDHKAAHELQDDCSVQQHTTLKVVNLQPDVWFQDLYKHFGSCAAPLSMHVHYYAYSSSAFICYASSDAARKVAKRFDGSEFNGYQMHISQLTCEAKFLVTEISDTKIGKEMAIKSVQDTHMPSIPENKKTSCASIKKKSLSLKQ